MLTGGQGQEKGEALVHCSQGRAFASSAFPQDLMDQWLVSSRGASSYASWRNSMLASLLQANWPLVTSSQKVAGTCALSESPAAKRHIWAGKERNSLLLSELGTTPVLPISRVISFSKSHLLVANTILTGLVWVKMCFHRNCFHFRSHIHTWYAHCLAYWLLRGPHPHFHFTSWWLMYFSV